MLERLDLKNSEKYIALQNLSIYYHWKNIKQQYKNNKLKIIAPTWNDEFVLPASSYSGSDIQEYIESMQKHETLTDNPTIHIYIIMVNNRLVFKTKEGYKLELQTPETIKLFGNTKNLIDKTKNTEYVLSPQVVEVVL